MNRFREYLWMVLAAVVGFWVFQETGLSATPETITSGAHSAPIYHWGLLSAGAVAVGTVTMEGLESTLGEVKTKLLSWIDKGEKEQRELGVVTNEVKTKITALQAQLDALDVKLAERHNADNPPVETLADFLKKDDGLHDFMRKKRGNYVIEFDAKQTAQLWERKTAITDAVVGYPTVGVLGAERIPGIVSAARRQFTVRNVLSARPTTQPLIYFVRVNSDVAQASPQQGEGHTKLENALTFTAVSEQVRTIATWIPASKQVLEDFEELLGFLETSLPYAVDLREEQQLLSGSGSGEDLNGLITQATAFDTALLPLSGSYNRIDVIGRAIQQITAADEIQPTFIVLNPVDWWAIRLTKDSQGRYILGDPMGPVSRTDLFGLTPIVTNSVASGTFLVGSGEPMASEIRDRTGMAVEISTQHGTYFTENMVAIRAEKRLALVVKRPASFITGTFVTSP